VGVDVGVVVGFDGDGDVDIAVSVNGCALERAASLGTDMDVKVHAYAEGLMTSRPG
jgi:hypothetical protein